MTLWSDLMASVDNWASRELKRPFTGYVESSGRKAIAAGKAFDPEASYFGIRMVEMNLREGGRFFTEFLPLGVVLTDFMIGEERRRRPTILSNKDIAEQLKALDANPGYIEFRNVYAVRRAPVKHDNLSLFVGLFRLPHHDVVKQILQIAADLTAQIGIAPGVADGLRIADKVYDGVAGLFGLDNVTPLFSYADGNALDRSGYLLIAGCGLDPGKAKQMRVVDDKLLLDGRRVSDFDYCLLAIEYTETLLPAGPDNLNPLTQLAFHRRWQGIARHTMLRETIKAEEQMLTLRADVLTSPELAENDRLVALAAYETSYDKLVERMTPKGSHRGGRGPLLIGRGNAAGTTPVVADVLQGIRIRLLSGADESPDDPDRLFALEASELRKSIADRPSLDQNATIALASALAPTSSRHPTNSMLG